MNWTDLLSEKAQVEHEEEPSHWSNYPINIFEKDYQSIISSSAFRRLQDKTQVFPLDKSDFVRTRLTHSIEVSTIAKQLGFMVTKGNAKYRITDFDNLHQEAENIPSVLSCAGLLHDLGNPPFGHFGEEVIRDWFKDKIEKNKLAFKGETVEERFTPRMLKDLYHFEGNAQALRILSKIKHKPQGSDANLTYSVMNTLIKYPTDSEHIDDSDNADIKLHKMGFFYAEEDLFHEICTETGTRLANDVYVRHPLTFLVEAADDIAYATSDLEDALKKELFTVDQFIAFYNNKLMDIPESKTKNKSEELINQLEKLRESPKEKRDRENDFVAFQKWMLYVKKWLMYVVAFNFSKNYDAIMEGTYGKDLFENSFHEHSIKILKAAMGEYVFNTPEILKLELAAKKILTALLDDFVDAVLYWNVEDDEHKLTKAQKKLMHLIPENYKLDYITACSSTDENMNLYLRFLMVTDFISGMTDSYARNLYRELGGMD